MPFDWSVFGSAISGALVGGLTTGFFALKTTKKAHDNQLEHATKNEEKLIQGLLQALHDEIETVFDRYQETIGFKARIIKRRGSPFNVLSPGK